MAAKRKSIILNLIRCGETPWAADGRIQGQSDLPLSPEGQTSVEADAQALHGRPIAMIYHAEDEAATETARIVAAVVGSKTKSVVELAEPNVGVFEGMTEQAFAERYPKRRPKSEETESDHV